MTYGFEIEDDTLRHRLRGPVPGEVLAWVERASGSRVVGQQALRGGLSAAVHRLRFADRADLVVQRFVLDWVTEEPWAPANETLVLGLLADSSLPVPRVIAADPDGRDTGVPTVLMTALPGEIVWDPVDLDSWLDGLLEIMQRIHAVPAAPELASWAAYGPEVVPPPWSRHRGAWQRALQAYDDERPPGDRVFVHRDFHPGNVLWSGGRVSGVVDWISACAGPAEEDVAHCRANLAMHHGQDVADAFLQRWLRVTGRADYHPYWDLLTAVSMADDEPDAGLDDFVAAAAARL